MPDQAQGLRTLVNRARRDQQSQSIGLDDHATDDPPSSSDTLYDSSHTSAAPPRSANHTITGAFAPDDGDLNDGDLNDGRIQAVVAATVNREPHRGARNATARRPARIVAVTSGKGGVGKTNFSTNLSVLLASNSLRVIVVDADLGLANLHVVCGVAPKYHLEHVMRGERSLREILCPGPNGIQLIAGASGLAELANLDDLRRSAFIDDLHELDQLADVIVIDTGAGLSRNVMAFLCAVEEVIVVTTPEPTAITDAYATIKVVSQENPDARLLLVVNMAQNSTEADAVASRLKSIAQRFLQRDLDYLGYVPQDGAVSKAVRAQQPFVLAFPSCQAANAIRNIASNFMEEQPTQAPQEGVGGLVARLQRYFGFARSSAAVPGGSSRKRF